MKRTTGAIKDARGGFALLLALALAPSVWAEEVQVEEGPSWESRGEVTLEARAFEDDDDKATIDEGAGIAARVEAKRFSESLDLKLRVFGRADQVDATRSQVIVEEAWAGYKTGDFSLRLGAQLLNWTATEAFHPADIVNSRNLDSNLENFEKIGEPMLSLAWNHEGWTLQGFLMPARMDPFLPAPSSRLSFAPSGVVMGEALWLGRDGGVTDRNVGFATGAQWGARVAHSFEGADISLHVVEHHDRSQPAVVVDPDTFEVHPLYLPITQFGGTYQQALGAFVLKLEAAHRRFELPSGGTAYGTVNRSNHSIGAFGLEYGWSHDNGSQSTWLLEGQGVFGMGEADRAALSPFQRDALVGFRHAFNDEMSRELMLSGIFDLERGEESLLSLTYSQRLSDTWSLKTAVRRIHAPTDEAVPVGLQALDGANQLSLTLTRHF
ncbi:MAG: hypothetical protein IT285_07260 [Bdellovibrionales bacterium]|nr:hypothetical protein [Bdellovibrionales bacterium]